MGITWNVPVPPGPPEVDLIRLLRGKELKPLIVRYADIEFHCISTAVRV